MTYLQNDLCIRINWSKSMKVFLFIFQSNKNSICIETVHVVGMFSFCLSVVGLRIRLHDRKGFSLWGYLIWFWSWKKYHIFPLTLPVFSSNVTFSSSQDTPVVLLLLSWEMKKDRKKFQRYWDIERHVQSSQGASFYRMSDFPSHSPSVQEHQLDIRVEEVKNLLECVAR